MIATVVADVAHALIVVAASIWVLDPGLLGVVGVVIVVRVVMVVGL